MIAKRKGLFLILDGLYDSGIGAFAGKTPSEQARTPNLDRLISNGQGTLVDPLYAGVPVGTHTGTGILSLPIRIYASHIAPASSDQELDACLSLNLGKRCNKYVTIP